MKCEKDLLVVILQDRVAYVCVCREKCVGPQGGRVYCVRLADEGPMSETVREKKGRENRRGEKRRGERKEGEREG